MTDYISNLGNASPKQIAEGVFGVIALVASLSSLGQFKKYGAIRGDKASAAAQILFGSVGMLSGHTQKINENTYLHNMPWGQTSRKVNILAGFDVDNFDYAISAINGEAREKMLKSLKGDDALPSAGGANKWVEKLKGEIQAKQNGEFAQKFTISGRNIQYKAGATSEPIPLVISLPEEDDGELTETDATIKTDNPSVPKAFDSIITTNKSTIKERYFDDLAKQTSKLMVNADAFAEPERDAEDDTMELSKAPWWLRERSAEMLFGNDKYKLVPVAASKDRKKNGQLVIKLQNNVNNPTERLKALIRARKLIKTKNNADVSENDYADILAGLSTLLDTLLDTNEMKEYAPESATGINRIAYPLATYKTNGFWIHLGKSDASPGTQFFTFTGTAPGGDGSGDGDGSGAEKKPLVEVLDDAVKNKQITDVDRLIILKLSNYIFAKEGEESQNLLDKFVESAAPRYELYSILEAGNSLETQYNELDQDQKKAITSIFSELSKANTNANGGSLADDKSTFIIKAGKPKSKKAKSSPAVYIKTGAPDGKTGKLKEGLIPFTYHKKPAFELTGPVKDPKVQELAVLGEDMKPASGLDLTANTQRTQAFFLIVKVAKKGVSDPPTLKKETWCCNNNMLWALDKLRGASLVIGKKEEKEEEGKEEEDDAL
jgi:hypothetical protein